MTTESEKLFEAFCNNNGIRFAPVSTGVMKTPDYIIQIGEIDIVVEVKQIELNEEEKKLLRRAEKGDPVVFSATPGDRIRSKIKAAAPQLKILAKGKHPALLVLYNSIPFAAGDPTHPYHIKTGMFGLETVILTKPPIGTGDPQLIDKKFGPKRQMTEEHNTTTSAIGVLRRTMEAGIEMLIYHNHFAAIPLPVGLCSKINNVKEFILSSKTTGEFQEWSKNEG